MAFLVPWFLAGAALLTAPWLIHRIRRPEREEIKFSSLMFVPREHKEIIENRKLQHILLMLLRMAVLLLLAFIFARPFVTRSEAITVITNDTQERHLILIDTSHSMQAAGGLSAIRSTARTIINDIPTGTPVGVTTFGRSIQTLLPLEEGSPSAASASLERLETSYQSTDYVRALQYAENALLSSVNQDADNRATLVLHLISDFQKSGLRNIEDGWRLSGLVTFKHYQLNITPTDVAITDLGVRINASGAVLIAGKVKSHSETDIQDLNVRLEIEGEEVDSQNLVLSAGNASRVSFLVDRPGAFSGRLIAGDASAGQVRYFTWRPPRKKEILLVRDPQPNTRYPAGWFVTRALEKAWRIRETDRAGLAQALETKPDMVAACDFTDFDKTTATILSQYLSEGGRLWLALNQNTPSAVLNRYLLDPLNIQSGETHFEAATENRYVILSRIDFKHSIFQPFQGSRFNDFSRIRFFNYRNISASDDDTRVLARFNNPERDPAIIERISDGGGHLILWAFGPDLTWTNLAKNVKFVPLLHESFIHLGGGVEAREAFEVGDMFNANRWPEAETIRLANGVELSPQQSATLETPGLVSIRTSNGWTPMDAVNMDAEEIDPTTIDPAEFALKLTTNSAQTIEAGEGISEMTSEKEERVELSYMGIPALFLFLLIETWLAARLSRRKTMVFSTGGKE